MVDREDPQVTVAFAEAPSSGVAAALQETLSTTAFETDDLCVLTAMTAVGMPNRDALPAGLSVVLTAAFERLGLPPKPTDDEIREGVKRWVRSNPVSDQLMQALESFRTEVLPDVVKQEAAADTARVLGGRQKKVARSVEDKPELTADRLFEARGGRRIIR